MFCRKCGNPVDGLKFCPSCGTPVEVMAKNPIPKDEAPELAEKTSETTKRKSGKKPLLIVVSALVVILLIAGVFFKIGLKHNTGDSVSIDEPEASAAIEDNAEKSDIGEELVKTDKPKEIATEDQSGTSEGDIEYIDGYTDWRVPTNVISYGSDGSVLSHEWVEYTLDDNDRLLKVSMYDEDGLNCSIEMTESGSLAETYEADGTSCERIECAYNEDENLLSWKLYMDGDLIEWEECTYDADGKILSWKSYLDDGTSQEEIFNSNGCILYEKEYDSEGNLSSWDERIYDVMGICFDYKSYGDDGTLIPLDGYTYDADGNILRHEYYDDSGALCSWREYTYDANGNVLNREDCSIGGGTEIQEEYIYSYTYDNEGNVLNCRLERNVYQGGLFYACEEKYCTFALNGNVLSEEYYHNGGLTAEYTYDGNGNILVVREYFGDESTREYTYDADGNILSRKEYGENGALLDHTEYEYEYTSVRLPAWMPDILEELLRVT